jgi:hypothetical protein
MPHDANRLHVRLRRAAPLHATARHGPPRPATPTGVTRFVLLSASSAPPSASRPSRPTKPPSLAACPTLISWGCGGEAPARASNLGLRDVAHAEGTFQVPSAPPSGQRRTPIRPHVAPSVRSRVARALGCFGMLCAVLPADSWRASGRIRVLQAQRLLARDAPHSTPLGTAADTRSPSSETRRDATAAQCTASPHARRSSPGGAGAKPLHVHHVLAFTPSLMPPRPPLPSRRSPPRAPARRAT